MAEIKSTPNVWDQQKDLLLFAQIVTQSHQLSLILENIQTMIKEINDIQNTWDKVEQKLTQKQSD